MRLRVYVEQSVDVDVDLRELLEEAFCLNAPERDHELKELVTRCVSALRLCPDELIQGLTPAARQIVADALREQAARYQP